MTIPTARFLETARDDLVLRELRQEDAPDYHALVQRNAAHLTRLGDYREQVAATEEAVAADFAEISEVAVAFGVPGHHRRRQAAELCP